MAILPTSLARVSNQLRSDNSLNQLTRTQVELMRVQNELTTGKRLNSPSDDPGSSAVAISLHKLQEQRDGYAANLKAASSSLSAVDSSLGDLSDLLLQAQQLASANVGDGVTQDQRDNAAVVVKSIYSQMLQIANKSFQGSYLYAGDKLDQPPFQEYAGGVRFVGSENELKNTFDENSSLSFQVNGADVWGALSTRIEGTADLTPSLQATTRLSDVRGATGDTVRPGFIKVGDGTVSKNIDLTKVDTLDDVIKAINNAGVGNITASLNSANNGISLTGDAGENITVNELGGGTTAGDLGILRPASSGAGVDLQGSTLQPVVTALTPISSLRNGGSINNSGFTITNGSKSATIEMTGVVTVEDLLNKINASDTGVRAEIKADGTGIRLLNPTQGTTMSISENGGTTAADLGIRSFGADTSLSQLNGGKGVRTVDGVDFRITDSNGVHVDVDLNSTTQTVNDVITAINTASSTAGAGVTASFSTTGNGIVLTDASTGTGAMSVAGQNFSQAAKDLGLDGATPGATITGSDVNGVTANGIFANISKLISAMQTGDKKAITESATGLDADYQRVVRIHGDVGARVQDITNRQSNLDDEKLANTKLLSDLEDTDFTEAISRFQLLQTALQAGMQTAGNVLNLSLLDYLK